MSSGAAATRSEVDETPYCEDEGGGGGDFPPTTQKTTASQTVGPT